MKRAPSVPRTGREVVLDAYKLSNAEARLVVASCYDAQEMRKRAERRHRKDINTPRQPQRRPHPLQSCGPKLLRAFGYALRSCSRIGAQRSARHYAGNKKAACRILSGKLQDSAAPIFLGLALH